MPTIILNMRTNGKDYLTPLPAEVQHNIIGYLFCSHDSDHIATYNPGATDRKHALDNLAATSKSLRNEVMAFARTWLLKHYDITDSSKKSSSSTGKVNYLRGRDGLLTWMAKHCIFCGKFTVRSATMMNGFRCCNDCDDTNWPDKITMSVAKSKYNLTEWDLLKLHHGLCASYDEPITMLMREDVETLTKIVHKTNDIDEFFALKAAERAERERKAKVTLQIIATEEARQRASTHPCDIWSPTFSSIATLPDISELPQQPFSTPSSMSERRRHSPPMIQTSFFHTTYNFPDGHTFTYHNNVALTPRKLAEEREYEDLVEAHRKKKQSQHIAKPVAISPRSAITGLRALGFEVDTPTAMKAFTVLA